MVPSFQPARWIPHDQKCKKIAQTCFYNFETCLKNVCSLLSYFLFLISAAHQSTKKWPWDRKCYCCLPASSSRTNSKSAQHSLVLAYPVRKTFHRHKQIFFVNLKFMVFPLCFVSDISMVWLDIAVQELRPLILAHVHLRGVWLTLERTTIRARAAHKRQLLLTHLPLIQYHSCIFSPFNWSWQSKIISTPGRRKVKEF